MRRLALPALLALCPLVGQGATPTAPPPAASPSSFLRPAHFARPMVASPHSYMTKVQLGYSQILQEFNIAATEGDDPRSFKLFIDAHLGADIPLWAMDLHDAQGRPTWSFAVSAPLSMHVLEDMFEALTAPVISTDYRFGAPLIRAIRRFHGGGWLRNVAAAWLPLYHECTHLGDEITIYRKDVALPITRINVSYEYTQLELTLNDADGRRESGHSFRLGTLMRLSDRDLGWYGVELEGTTSDGLALPQNETRFEFWAAWQWQRADGLAASPDAMNVLSVEVRNRPQYGVPTFKKGEDGAWEPLHQDEVRRTGISAYWGWRFTPETDAHQSVGLYLHAYAGVNPYGQLRSMYPYRFFGITLAHEPW